MSVSKFEIKTYKVTFRHMKRDNHVVASILLGLGTAKAHVGFIDDEYYDKNRESYVLQRQGDGNGEYYFNVWFEYSKYSDIVNLLRYEKPVYFLFNDSSPDPSEYSACIYTGDEPVGEEENGGR